MSNRRFFFAEMNRNDLLSIAMMAFFFTFFVGIAFLFGLVFGTLIIPLVIAFVMLGIIWYQYHNSHKIVLKHFKARPANMRDVDEVEFQHSVEEMAIASGLPVPKAYVIDDLSPNAFATGRNPQNAVICATIGLLKMMNKDEVRGVIGHEMAHIRNRDVKIMTIAAVMAGTILTMAVLFRNMLWFGGMGGSGGRGRGGGQAMLLILAVSIIMAIIAPIFAAMIKAFVSRKREFMADATSAMLTRHPEGLANALQKIEEYPQPMKMVRAGEAHLFIANPLKKTGNKKQRGSVFSTHPPMQERIKRLREM